MYAMVVGTRYPPKKRPVFMSDCFARQKCIMPDNEIPWYDSSLMPPVSLYVGGRDKLVDGRKLITRFETTEKEVVLVRSQVDEEYEHLDCLWSMDCIERVGKKVREDIWFTAVGEQVITPDGCNEEDKGKLVSKRIY
jgi:hypothetical protein